MAQNLTYIPCGDYYIPDTRLANTETQTLGKYGRMRREFLEQNKPMLFNDMVLTESLFPHLWEIQQTCEKRMELLMEKLLVKNPAPDKATHQLAWIGAYEQFESTGRRNHSSGTDLLGECRMLSVVDKLPTVVGC